MILSKKPGIRRFGTLLLVLTVLSVGLFPTSAHSSALVKGDSGDAGETVTASPAWLEPRGMAIIELVGQVPEQYLQGTILSHDDGEGIVVYESGSRVGNTVVVTTSIYPRVTSPTWTSHLTSFGCIGTEPHFDHMGSVVPASVLRVYTDSGAEVTARILDMYVVRMDKRQPSAGSSQAFRYPTLSYGPGKTYPLPIQPDGLHIPTNSGCRVRIPDADYDHLTGVFSLELNPEVTASVVAVQQASFKSYIGPGDVGIFQPLMEQLQRTYGSRAFRVGFNPPSGATHFMVRYPPMPGDPYTDRASGPPYPNADRPVSGSYRLWRPVHELSTDHLISAAFPVGATWRDADQAPGTLYLPLMTNPTELATPEYVIPAGVTYQDCFTTGTCNSTILQQIYNTSMTLDILYLSISKPRLGGEWVSLKMAGPQWTPSAADTVGIDPDSEQSVPAGRTSSSVRDLPADEYAYRVYLPLISTPIEIVPTGCPCGWFDNTGRMLGFWP